MADEKGGVDLIGDAATKRARKKAMDLSIQQMFRHVLNGKAPGIWPTTPRRFEVICDVKGVRTIIEIQAGGVCKHVAREAAVNELIRYSIHDLVEFDAKGALELMSDKAEKIVKQWLGEKAPFDVKQIQPVLQKSQPGYCWQRLEFDLTPGNYPNFEDLFSQASNVKAIMQWIGSLFDGASPRHQYCYLRGDGGDGKSTLLDFLRRTFGPSYKAEQPPAKSGDRFWTHGLLGMRVVALDDFTAMWFLNDGLFRGLTGGSTMRVEEKGGKTADGDFCCKLIISANPKPQFERLAANERRIIYSEWQPRKIHFRESFKDDLWAEAPHFLHACIAAYQELPAGDWIPTDTKDVEDVLADADEENDKIFNEYFHLDPAATLTPAIFLTVLQRAAEMDNRKIHAFKKYLEQKHKIRRKRNADRKGWDYPGLAVAPEILTELAQAIAKF